MRSLPVILAVFLFADFQPSRVLAQFAPGHIFISDFTGKACASDYYPDRIWEVDPETGDSWLFAELTGEWCGGVNGMAVSPDGTKLRVAQFLKSRILEFDAEGNPSIFFAGHPEFVAPLGLNCVTFDRRGTFYVASFRRIFRFAPGSNTAEIYANDEADPLLQRNSGAITIDHLGDLYIAQRGGGGHPGQILRFQGAHNASVFETIRLGGSNSLAADACGFLYSASNASSLPGNAQLFRYLSGDPSSKELLVEFDQTLAGPAIAIGPSQTFVYTAIGIPPHIFRVPSSGGLSELITIVASATHNPAGIAVVPVPDPSAITPCPSPIPTVSAWGLSILTMLLLIGGKLHGMRMRAHVF